MVLVSALMVLLAREDRIEFAYVGFVPVFVFWGLDGYFLWQERLFRDLYDHVRVLREADIDFSMDIRSFRRTWVNATFSTTLIPFYGALILSVGVATIVI